MKIFKVLDIKDGYEEVKISLEDCLNEIRPNKNKKYRGILTLDTEVNTFGESKCEFSLLYKFQICLDGIYTILGDTTNEFIEVINIIYDELATYNFKGKTFNTLRMFGHNIAYDFYILRPIFEKAGWDIKKVVGSNSNAKAVIFSNGVTLQCTYKYSEQSLAKLTKDCLHPKHKEDLDYNKFHHPYAKLTDQELIYCLNDVTGLYEWMKKEISLCKYKDVYDFPMTKTSRVRKDFRNLLKSSYYSDKYTLKELCNIGGRNKYFCEFEYDENDSANYFNVNTLEMRKTIYIKPTNSDYDDIDIMYSDFTNKAKNKKCSKSSPFISIKGYLYRIGLDKEESNKTGTNIYKLRAITRKDNLNKTFSKYYKNYNLFDDKSVLDRLVTSYEMTQKANRGGLTHANMSSLGIIEDDVVSFDAVSHYPSIMATHKFGFLYVKDNKSDISYKELFKDKLFYDELIKSYQVKDDKHDYILKMKLINFKSKHGLVYIPIDKIVKGSFETDENNSIFTYGSNFLSTKDNGYLVYGSSVEYIGYLSDLNCILGYYDTEDIIIEEVYRSSLNYLTDEERVHVCKMYADKAYYKSELKILDDAGKSGTEEYELATFNQSKSKTMLNGEFGVDDTDHFKYFIEDYILNPKETIEEVKMEYEEKLKYKLKGFDPNCTNNLNKHDLLELYVLKTFKWNSDNTRSFIVGPQITAKGRYILARLNLYLLANGIKVVYNDTDSTKIKFNETAKVVLEKYNNEYNKIFYECKEELKSLCNKIYPQEQEKFKWFDNDSLKMCHFENENIKKNKETGVKELYISEFYTIGAKRYITSKRNALTDEYYKLRDKYKKYLDTEIEPTEKECPNKLIRELWQYRDEPYYECKCAGVDPEILMAYLYNLPHNNFKEYAYHLNKGLSIPSKISHRTIDHRTEIIGDMKLGAKHLSTEYKTLYDRRIDENGNIVKHKTRYRYKYVLIQKNQDDPYVLLYLKDRDGKVRKFIANNGINITESDFKINKVDDDVLKNMVKNREENNYDYNK